MFNSCFEESRFDMHNVLLIDDDQNILEVMKARLESNDYCVSTATEPEEALMKAKDKVFDLAVRWKP